LRISIIRLIFFSVLLIPILPKLKLMESVYLYPFEIIMIIILPFLLTRMKYFFHFRVQRILFVFWSVLFISTLLSFLYAPIDGIGIAKIIKGLLYIPIVFVAYSYMKDNRSLFYVLVIGIIAMISNFSFWLYSFLFVNLGESLMWDIRFLSSGFSNKYFYVFNGSFGIIDGGTHGIWGSYCIILLVVAITLREEKIISLKLLWLSIGLVLLSISISVSRESLLLLLVFVMFYFIYNYKRILFSRRIVVALSMIFILTIVIIYFGEHFLIIQKLQYSIERLGEVGTESNIQKRINTWLLTLAALFNNPELLLFGFGYNSNNYVNFLLSEIDLLGSETHMYATVPESLPMTGFAYGGILGLLIISVYIAYILILLLRYSKYDNFARNFLFLFIGLIITNSLSGASLIADLVYSQVLLMLGFIYRRNSSQ
jgi:hypothetical protein